MAPINDEDWSDSDEEEMSEVETSVLLGVPDGPIVTATDMSDAAVSRIGGHPAFLPSREPLISASHCKICSNPTELLVQMWCPFEDSPMDRALYIWGCARSECQGKDGSVRAWRGLRYNVAYAAKLEKKLARKREQAKAKADAEAAKKPKGTYNPFSMNASAAPNPFGVGNQIFASVPITPAGSSDPEVDVKQADEDADSDSESISSTESLLTAMAATTVAESPWASAPSYPPLYLSTSSEYILPTPKSKLPAGVEVTDPLEESGGKGGKDTKDVSWAFEPYENSLDVDYVFERFTKRVGYENSQCVRYELAGAPLPFATDPIFESLYPSPPAPPLPITKAAFTVVPTQKRVYTTSSIPACPICGSARVFECQLMPNLINVLKNASTSSSGDGGKRELTDEERRKEVQEALRVGGKSSMLAAGMEWGTSMIFSCEQDCCFSDDGKEDAKDAWREEVVLIQWDLLTSAPGAK